MNYFDIKRLTAVEPCYTLRQRHGLTYLDSSPWRWHWELSAWNRPEIRGEGQALSTQTLSACRDRERTDYLGLESRLIHHFLPAVFLPQTEIRKVFNEPQTRTDYHLTYCQSTFIWQIRVKRYMTLYGVVMVTGYGRKGESVESEDSGFWGRTLRVQVMGSTHILLSSGCRKITQEFPSCCWPLVFISKKYSSTKTSVFCL